MALGKETLEKGEAVLGIELGSTRIKAVAIDREGGILAKGEFAWENRLEEGIWTYSLEDAWRGLRSCYSALLQDARDRLGAGRIRRFAATGVSGMMHGYLPFDDSGEQLAPFRTWRNNITSRAADELTELFAYNIPQRWSIAHLYHSILEGEEHVPRIRYLTTLAGYIHWRLTGERVIGIDEASGMFPIDTAAGDFNRGMVQKFDELIAPRGLPWRLGGILPRVLVAGECAGTLTEEGARLLDASGTLEPGIPLCPPEGDAGTGMVATASVRVRTGNISAGTSAFAMLVLEKELSKVYRNLDMVTTPSGSLVAMAHSNNCSTAINAWVGIFSECLGAFGMEKKLPEIYETLFKLAEKGDPDCGDLMAYCLYSGEHGVNLASGCPMVLHPPKARFTLANLMRVQIYTAFAAMRLGIDTLIREEGAAIDRIVAHGGIFKTPGVAQRILAAATNAPIAVMETAGEGGAWGIALLAAYLAERIDGSGLPLEDYLEQRIFCHQHTKEISPDPAEVAGYERFIERWRDYLEMESLAARTANNPSKKNPGLAYKEASE